MEGITRYNQLNKVEPMDRALNELGARTWFSGLRREQSGSRGKLPVLAIQRGRFKFPAGDRLEQQGRLLLLQEFDLPYHPLWEQGYLSVGDVHPPPEWGPA